MGVRRSTVDQTSTGPERTHLTTVILEEFADGTWRATQTGVDVEGRGDTVAEAATAYCAKLSGGADAG